MSSPTTDDTFELDYGGVFDNSGVIVFTDDGRTIDYDTYVVEFGVDQDGFGEAEAEGEAEPAPLPIEEGVSSVDERTKGPFDETRTVPIVGLVQYDSFL